jgi:hypothetical protein
LYPDAHILAIFFIFFIAGELLGVQSSIGLKKLGWGYRLRQISINMMRVASSNTKGGGNGPIGQLIERGFKGSDM